MDTRTAINHNLVYLEQNITDLPNILTYLVQNNIVSHNEREEIESEKTTQAKNSKLLRILQRKGLPISTFFDILRATSNQHCANIIQGFVYLAENITNLTAILEFLRQDDIISEIERKEIEIKGETTMKNNLNLLNVIKRKNLSLSTFAAILRKANNGHCVKAIEGNQNLQELDLLQPKILKKKWWQDIKILIKCLQKRKIGDKLLIEELHDRILRDENRMVVICESADAAKLTGLGGVGKTLTATWYAHHYEHEYDHVIWIDAGEDSPLTSFKKLARDLKIEDRNEFIDLKDYLISSYEALEKFKCLWIFDNAENCRGDDGIQTILPVKKNNFYCLITSRLRDWGIPNVGYEQISRFELNIFWEKESLDFLKENLDKEIQHTDGELKQLCLLLGNLPLAMQLAVAALNVKKIDVRSYIEKASRQDSESNTFDDYEKTINASVNITLELIGKEEGGSFAKEVLNVFGYIRPDNVEQSFLTTVFNCDSESTELEMTKAKEECNSREKKAIELLTKYSLITQVNTTHYKKFMTCFSIHRLLQQVIRYHGRKTEKDTLRKILCCEGFLNYKLLPFTKYADDEVRKEFPKINAELLDQKELKKLLRENRFEESLVLSKFIDKEINVSTTKFNYSLCLEMNEKLDDSITVLEELYRQDIEDEGNYSYNNVQMGLLELEKIVTKELVGGHLLVSHWKINNEKRIKEILEERTSFQVIPSQERLTTLLIILNSNLIQSNYSLTNGGTMLKITLDRDTKKLYGNGIDSNMIVGEGLPKKLNTLDIDCSRLSTIILSLKCISLFDNITLSDCSLSLDSGIRICPTELKLKNVSFFKNGQKLSDEMKVNEFIDLHKTNRLELCLWNKKLSIDLGEESANMEYLYLCYMNVVSLQSVDGRVNIKEAKIENCSLELSILPTSLEKLTLSGTEVSVNERVDLPYLKYLTLDNTSFLSHFPFPQLTYLYLRGVEEINVDLLPPSAKIIRIVNTASWISWIMQMFNWLTNKSPAKKFLGGVIHLDTLILSGFPLEDVEEMLPHFHPQQLVLLSEYTPSDLIRLMKKQIPIIAIGKVQWRRESDFRNSPLPKHVNRQSEYYFFHEGKGKAIQQKAFDALLFLAENISEH